MDRLMLFRLFAIIALAISIFSCNEDNENDLSGRWNFIEPPHPVSRINRGQDPTPAFDLVFAIDGREFKEVDLTIYGEVIEDESARFEGANIIVESSNFALTMERVRRVGPVLEIRSASWSINGSSDECGSVQIDKY